MSTVAMWTAARTSAEEEAQCCPYLLVNGALTSKCQLRPEGLRQSYESECLVER